MLIENLSFGYGDKAIFNDVNFALSKGDKAGIVGSNGAGKTTFFKLILGEVFPEQGDIQLKNESRVGYLPQIIAEDAVEREMTVREYILAARPIAELEEKLNKLYEKMAEIDENQDEVLAEAQRLQDMLEVLDWYDYESIMLNIAYNMQINDSMLEKKMSELSGGQKSKVAFAKLLYSKQDIMLLDEPTNHLDDETRTFVIEFLKSYKGTILVISHDVKFLNAITNVTLFFDARTKKVVKYNGNYDVFLKLHAEYEEQLLNKAKKQDEEIRKLENVIARFDGVSGKRKKIAQDREKKLDRIKQERIVVAPKEETVDFKMKINREENDIPIKVNKLSFSYPGLDKQIISNLSFTISKGERFLVVGENGAGKSTLLKLIKGVLKPDKGVVTIGTKVDFGYYAQEHEGLDLNRTILENFSEFNMTNTKLRSLLAHFLFYGDDVNKKLSVLSPGERARVALAKLVASGSNTILLDEPTNHLDPATQEIIAEVFREFAGTIIVVSHNHHFVDSLGIERMLVLPEGRMQPYSRRVVEKFNKIYMSNIDKFTTK